MEDLINRARRILGFVPEVEAAEVLIEAGTAPEMAFLAVKAAAVLNRRAG